MTLKFVYVKKKYDYKEHITLSNRNPERYSLYIKAYALSFKLINYCFDIKVVLKKSFVESFWFSLDVRELFI